MEKEKIIRISVMIIAYLILGCGLGTLGYVIKANEENKCESSSKDYMVSEMAVPEGSDDFGYIISHRLDSGIARGCYINYIDGEYESVCLMYYKNNDTIVHMGVK